MATLTGFKSVAAEQQLNNRQAANNMTNGGQQNPVFVFDEVDVNNQADEDINNKEDNEQSEEFVDASSHSSNSAAAATMNNKQENEAANKNINMKQQQQQQNQKQVPSHQAKQQSHTPPTEKRPPTSKSSSASATTNQLEKGKRELSSSTSNINMKQNTLLPKQPDEDAISTSMLAIDCVGTGKSPRTPRRSPLMALFRGKPRESVRRLYTDEDQFEIEWANLSLEVQKKWYNSFSLTSILKSTSATNKNGEKDQEAQLKSTHTRPSMILNNVDGRIKSGEITAVLGPSGAGKTSLLNSLFGKYRTAIHGSIRVTGAPSKKHLTVCTIPQSDYLIGYLTTEETLWFASRLKNCELDFNHERNIERVIELLGLQRCRHTRINKLSGGQYKRVSIAQEMLSSPDILVLDEPTSGLDSLTCYRTVKVLRDLVEASKAHNLVNPMSIILTIHQPHREVLDLFHSVYVMAVGGQTLFQGPPHEMESCINEHSGVNMPAQGYNPASFMVELASEEYGRKPIEALVLNQRQKFKNSTKHHYEYDFTNLSNDDGVQLNNQQQQKQNKNNNMSKKLQDSNMSLYPLSDSSNKQNNSHFIEVELAEKGMNNNQQQSAAPAVQREIDSRIMTPRSGKNSDGVFWRHVSLMSRRCFLSNTRDPLLCTIRVGAHIFIPLVVALIYGPRMGIPNGCPFYKPEINLLEYASMGVEEIQEKHDDIRIQFQNVGLHFMVYYAFGLCMLAFTAISFPLIMHVLIKEIRNGWYSLATFILGKMFAELPMAIILPPISVGIIYYMTGQPSSYLQWRYLVQSFLLVLIIMIAEAKGLIFGAICMNSMQTAVFAASVSTVPFILLSGFLIRIREVPYVLQHFARFSYFKHSVEALILTRYGFGMCPCDPDLIPVGGVPHIIGIPPQIMSLTDYYVNAFVASTDNSTAEVEPTTETNLMGNNRNINKIVSSITTLSPEVENVEVSEDNSRQRARRQAAPTRSNRLKTSTTTTTTSTTTPTPTTTTLSTLEDNSIADERAPKQGLFFDKLATLLTRANAFGYSIQSCEDVEPFTMKDMQLKDHMLAPIIGYMFLYIVILKFISYFIVEICIKLKL